MSRANPKAFDPKVVLALVLFGAIAFIATLYFIGTGNTGRDVNDGNAHGAGRGLNGYAAFAGLLEEEGYDVTLSRSPSEFDDYNLLVLTPPLYADAEELSKIINGRQYIGPTLVILPKWYAYAAQNLPGSEVEDGWVHLGGATTPEWPGELDFGLRLEIDEIELADVAEDTPGEVWRGMNIAGRLPRMESLSTRSPALVPLIESEGGETLAGYVDDGGYYPYLVDAEYNPEGADGTDSSLQPVIFVVEPDLVNNYGFASPESAAFALALTERASNYGSLPVTFDLTLNGLGSSQNLLTLAFTPPFLAATLCLILAMIVVGWRAFRRFGPPATEGRMIAFGKARLVENSAGFIQRSKRLHLLSVPYANMIRDRIAKTLGLRQADDEAIAAALSRRTADGPDYSPDYAEAAHKLRNAQTKQELLRAAAALRSIERTLDK